VRHYYGGGAYRFYWRRYRWDWLLLDAYLFGATFGVGGYYAIFIPTSYALEAIAARNLALAYILAQDPSTSTLLLSLLALNYGYVDGGYYYTGYRNGPKNIRYELVNRDGLALYDPRANKYMDIDRYEDSVESIDGRDVNVRRYYVNDILSTPQLDDDINAAYEESE
jgi:hypothetical protein